MKFIYTIDPGETKPIILVNKHIGRITNAKGETEDGVMGEQLQRELLELERMGKECAEIWINSPGGVVSDGWSIYGTIRNSKLHITGLNIGIAASTAGWIFEACHERIMMDYSIVMMHLPAGQAGNPHGSDAGGQKEYTKSIATMLAARAGKKNSEVLKLMKATTFMTADEAFRNGFCDIVRESNGVEVFSGPHLLATQTDNLAATTDNIWIQGNEILNSILPVKKHKMSQVTNLLNLDDGASEAAIIAEIRKLQSRVNEMEDAEKENEDKLNEYETELAELQRRHEAEMNALKEKYDALKNAKDAADKKHNEDNCRNMVEGFINMGRIKADTKDKWLHTARTLGVAEAKTLIESMPLNITAPRPLDAAHMEGIKTLVTSVDEWRDEWEEKKAKK